MEKTIFKTTLLQAGKTATGIEIPTEIVESLNAGKKPPIRVTINNRYTYRNTVAVMGGVYMVGVSAEHRKGANVAGGDEIEVMIELDTEPRVVVIPIDFQEALNNDALAKERFEKMSYSHKNQHVLHIEGAKTAETRAKRIEKALTALKN